MPEEPIYPVLTPGTGFETIRPDLTGAPVYSSGGAAHLNAAAYAAPVAGQWGTAGRNSITGPDQLTLTSQLARTFRPHGKWYLDFEVNSTNTLNHPEITRWHTNIDSTLFGLPAGANAMRSVQTVIYLRWQ